MTIETKHTAGPWTVGGSLISGGAGVTIARVLRRPAIYGGKVHNLADTDRDAPEYGAIADANARLIAAAPCLLDKGHGFQLLVVRLLSALDDGDAGRIKYWRERVSEGSVMFGEVCDRANGVEPSQALKERRAAIRKATGEA